MQALICWCWMTAGLENVMMDNSGLGDVVCRMKKSVGDDWETDKEDQ